MRFPPSLEDRSPEVNVVALIDVLFAILTFFIITSLTLSRTEGLAVNTPTASYSKIQDQSKVVITIDASGAIYLNRRPIESANLSSQIQALMVKDRPQLVVINADERVDHGRVVAVMDLVQKIPGATIGIATKHPQS